MPETLQVPEAPQVPETLQVSEAPRVPEMLQVSEVPRVSEQEKESTRTAEPRMAPSTSGRAEV